MADIGRTARQGGGWEPKAVKPKDYEPPSMLQEFAPTRRTFTLGKAGGMAFRIGPVQWAARP